MRCATRSDQRATRHDREPAHAFGLPLKPDAAEMHERAARRLEALLRNKSASLIEGWIMPGEIAIVRRGLARGKLRRGTCSFRQALHEKAPPRSLPRGIRGAPLRYAPVGTTDVFSDAIALTEWDDEQDVFRIFSARR